MIDPLAPAPAERGPAAWPVWQLGRFRFHSGTRQLADEQGESQSLTLKSAEVLKRLIAGGGEVVSRDRLIAEVWHGNSYTGSQALTHTVWQLRRALDAGAESGESAIATVSKSGYRLMLAVSAVAPAVETSPERPPDSSPETPLAVSPEAPPLPADQAVPAAPPALPAVAAMAPVARPRWPLALAAALLASVLLAAAAVWVRQRSVPAAIDTVTTPPQPLTMQDGVEDFPAYSADGKRLAYTWQGAEGPAHIRIDDLDTAAKTPSREIADAGGQSLARPVWLGPQRLAYVRAGDASDCRVFVVALDSGSRRDVAACYYARGQPVLDASPDGQWLAIARHGEGSASVGIVLHHLADAQERVVTRPAAGYDDAEIAWSHDGKRIAFLRSNATVGDLYLLDVASGATTRLTRDEAPVGGLAWAADDRAIVFNSARGGSFATWRLAPDGGEPTLFARVDTPLNLASVPGQPLAVAASVHRFSDHIELYRLSDGQRLSAITSSGRDLYGQACPTSRQVIFNSLRSGRVELWRSDGQGQEARRLEMPPGIPEPAACLAGSSRFATSLRPPGAAFDQLVFGDVRGGPPQLYGEAAHFTNVTWAPDGRSVIVASDRGHGAAAGASAPDEPGDGDWDLWRLDLGSHHLQRLTDDHASFGREVATGNGRWLYYARLGQPGLWRRALSPDGTTTGPPEVVTTRLATDDWGNWQWHAGALWLMERAAGEDRLVRLAPDGSAKTVLSQPRGFVRPYSSLSMGEDGVALLTVSGPRQADIMRIGPP